MLNKHQNVWAIIALFVFFLCGCSPHKPMKISPPQPIPNKFNKDLKLAKPPILSSPWWLSFNDKTLNRLLEEAFTRNLDLKAGIARLLEAKALLAQASSTAYPQLTGQANWRKSEEPGFFGRNRGESYRLSLSASYEVDLWNKLRSSRQAAGYQLKATEEDLKTFFISLAAEVTEAYYTVASLQAQVDLLRRLIKNSRRELNLIKDNYLQGLSSAQEVLEAENRLFTLEAQKTSLEKALTQSQHALAVLLGRWPQQKIPVVPTLPSLKESFPLGLPSVILNQRPDVQAAYWRVKAADAQVAALIAQHFPKIDLLATLGRSRTAFSIGDIVGSFWSLGIEASLSLFDAGRLNAQISAQRAKALEALYAYQKTLLKAFQEIEDALAANQANEKRLRELAQRKKALTHILQLEQERYELGLSDYLPVLKARKALMQTELEYLQAQEDLLMARITLYRALGGAWTEKYVAQAMRGAHES